METDLRIPVLQTLFIVARRLAPLRGLRFLIRTGDIINLGERVRVKILPSFWIFFWISVLLCLAGWGGLVYLILETLPFLGQRWLFFLFLMLAFTGLALPVTYFLNRRFPSDPPADSSIVLREAMWAGVYACALAWLQMGRVLNPGLIMVLASGLLLVEFLLRLRERTVWAPKPVEDAAAEDGVAEEDEEEDEFNND